MEFKTPPREHYKHSDSHKVPSEPEHRPQPAEVVSSKTRSKLRTPRIVRRWWKVVLGVLIVAAVVWLAYGYVHTKNELAKLSNPQTAGQTETQRVVSQIGKLVDLPTGETPTLATVKDASKLKNQSFFADAQDGDKVLIYTRAGKAVLYRPTSNKIVQYSRVNLNGS